MTSDHSGFVLRIAFTTIMLASLYLVANRPVQLWIGCLLVIPVMLTNWSFDILVDQHRVVANALFQVVFLCYVSGHILIHLVRARAIDADLIFAALCLYLVVGLIYGSLFVVIELLIPGSIKTSIVQSISNPEYYRHLQAEFIYFSFVTLSTLGYGDLSPNLPLARSICVLEALTGQVYLAVIIARIVGLQVSGRDAASSRSD
jgi:hypothetical protein